MVDRLRLWEFESERVRVEAELVGLDADLVAATEGIARLTELENVATNTLAWTTKVTAQRADQAAAELQALAEQKQLLLDMLSEQRKLLVRASADVEAGLISRADYATIRWSLP
jgi:hypothetical protein